jgi:hypothetical protein
VLCADALRLASDSRQTQPRTFAFQLVIIIGAASRDVCAVLNTFLIRVHIPRHMIHYIAVSYLASWSAIV